MYSDQSYVVAIEPGDYHHGNGTLCHSPFGSAIMWISEHAGTVTELDTFRDFILQCIASRTTHAKTVELA